MSFLAELKRRNVIRMAGLYLVGAWLVVQVAATLLPVFEAPGWVMKALVALLVIGFVAAVIFVWVFELTPEGLKRDAEVAPEHSIAPQTARRLDRGIIVVLLLALGFFAFDRFVLVPQREVALLAQAAKTAQVQPSPTPSPTVASAVDPRASIAVLPFINMSSNQEQEYFSDGLSEELLNQLAHIEAHMAAAHTQAFLGLVGASVEAPPVIEMFDVVA